MKRFKLTGKNIKCDKLIYHLDGAMDRAKGFPRDTKILRDEVGTCMPVLIEHLKKD